MIRINERYKPVLTVHDAVVCVAAEKENKSDWREKGRVITKIIGLVRTLRSALVDQPSYEITASKTDNKCTLGHTARSRQRSFWGIWLGIGLLVIGHWELPPPAALIDLCSSSSIRDDLC